MTLLNLREAKAVLLSGKIGAKARLLLTILGLLLSIFYMLFFVPRFAGVEARRARFAEAEARRARFAGVEARRARFAGQTSAKLNAKELIELTNDERLKNNLPMLSISAGLNQAAGQKANDIFKWQKFSHDLPGQKFSDQIKAVGYEYAVTGENLAEGFASAEAIIKAWLKSEGHRANILNSKYQEIGLSVKRDKLDGRDTYVVVQYFGAQLYPPIILSENFWPSGLLKSGQSAINS